MCDHLYCILWLAETANGDGADWDSESKHTTTIVSSTPTSVLFHRKLDFDEFHVACRWSANTVLSKDPTSAHAFVLQMTSQRVPIEDVTSSPSSDAIDDGIASVATVELSCMLTPYDVCVCVRESNCRKRLLVLSLIVVCSVEQQSSTSFAALYLVL